MKKAFSVVGKNLTTTRTAHTVSRNHLLRAYLSAKEACEQLQTWPQANPRAVFSNNELNLSEINVYGFDYDYTLAVYTLELNELIYKLALNRLVAQFKYPEELRHIAYNKDFAIRGLHYDIQNCTLLKVDAFSQIQKGTVYRGKHKLTDDQIRRIYPGFGLPDVKGRSWPQLIDLFSLPWAGLLSTVIQYCDQHNINFDPKSLYDDLAECVRQVHITGEMYARVGSELNHYVHPNPGLKEYLEKLWKNEKELFVVTNSPFKFINIGMKYMLGDDWRKYFKYIIVSAKKPTFFHGKEPFRLYDEHNDALRFEPVSMFQNGIVYAGGNIDTLSKQAGYCDRGVLYFGDHIYTDLADPILRLGWRTAAVVPELAREIRTQNEDAYRTNIQWLEMLTNLIEKYQVLASRNKDTNKVLDEWRTERGKLRESVKVMFNPQFGSLFRTYNNMTYFSRRLSRLSDVYTSRVPNMLQYDLDHCFFPRRNALPHENFAGVPFDVEKAVERIVAVNES